jgi:integrase
MIIKCLKEDKIGNYIIKHIINRGDSMNIIQDYCKQKINGLNYVRELKDEGGNRNGYLLIDNFNRPIRDVYDYLRYINNKLGCSLNSMKRFTYDIAYFYDFLLINNLDVELIDYSLLNHFIAYLRKIDPSYKARDCINRSMIREIPILLEYKFENIKILDDKKINGLSDGSISRIMNYVKNFMEYLKIEKRYDIDLASLFMSYNNKNSRTRNRFDIGYSVNGILKACKVKVKNPNKVSPIDAAHVFLQTEKALFFETLYNISMPMYQLLFYLLSVTGMRIAEALALKLYRIDKNNNGFEFKSMSSSIVLENDKENLWRVYIIIDPNDPPDLKVKNNKERSIPIYDGAGQLRSLLTNALYYREYKTRKKKKTHNYLFINRNGDRMRAGRVLQHFYEILDSAGLHNRKGGGQLVVHSFRHTYASEYISKLKAIGFDIELEMLSEILGHSNSQTTKSTYIHFFEHEILELLKKMEISQKQR